MEASKKCSRCGVQQDIREFSWQAKRRRASCRTCQAAYYKRWREADPAAYAKRKRASNLRNKFGITIKQYEEALAAQNGGCAICGYFHEEKALSVDHCHETGFLRGLLCDCCNTGIGKLGDDPAMLRRAVRYLENPPGIPGTQRKAPRSRRKPPRTDPPAS